MIIKALNLCVLACVLLCSGAGAQQRNGKVSDHIAPTPPMGWNSWNRFGCNRLNEQLIRETADAMVASGMRDAGYRYVVIDDCWQAGRDAQGNILPDPKKFPSGMKALGDYIHARGLKFGIYTAPGEKTCAKYEGSLNHEERDARAYAAWGVDFLKLDWCDAKGSSRDIAKRWRAALDATGRPIVLSINAGRLAYRWAGEYANMWRTTTDIMPCWDCPVFETHGLARSVVAVTEQQVGLENYSRPNAWNDADMMQVGNGGMTDGENRAHFSLWAILAAPLIAGNDLRDMSPATRAILTNKEVIAVNQDSLGRQGTKVGDTGTDIPSWYGRYGQQIWVKPLAGIGERAVVFLNRGRYKTEMTINWRDIGLQNGAVRVRDLWAGKDSGAHAEGFKTEVAPHDVVMIRVKGRELVNPPSASQTGNLNVPTAQKDTVYELERCVASRASFARFFQGYTGNGYLEFHSAPQEKFVHLPIFAARDGIHQAEIRYANGDATPHALELNVNGESAGEVVFPSTKEWTGWQSVRVSLPLKKGGNAVSINSRAVRAPVLDHLKIVELPQS